MTALALVVSSAIFACTPLALAESSRCFVDPFAGLLYEIGDRQVAFVDRGLSLDESLAVGGDLSRRLVERAALVGILDRLGQRALGCSTSLTCSNLVR